MGKSWVMKVGHSLREKDWNFLEPFSNRRIGLSPNEIVELPTYNPEVMKELVELGVIYGNRYGRYVLSRGEFDDLS